MSDAAIVISAELDNEQMEKDLAELEGDIKKREAALAESHKAEAAAIKAKDKAYRDLMKSQEALTKVQGKRDALLSVQEPLIQQMDDLRLRIDDADKRVQKFGEDWIAGVVGADKEQEDARAELKKLQAEYDALLVRVEKMDPAIDMANADLLAQEATVNRLGDEFRDAELQANNITKEIAEAEGELSAAKEEAGGLVRKLSQAGASSEAMEKAVARAQKSMNRFSLRLREVVRSALVFTLITQSLAKFRDWVGDIVKTNAEATAAVAKLKGALLTMAQPLVNIIIPAFIYLVNVLTQVISPLAQLFAMLSGTSIKASREAAEALHEETEALEGTGKAADKASGSLAGFDEINKLSSGSSSEQESIAPDFSFEATATEGELQNILGLVTAIGAGFLAWKISDMLKLDLGKTLWLALAIYAAIQFVKTMFDAWTNGVDMENITGMLASTVGLALGLAMAFGQVAAGAGVLAAGLLMLVTGFHDAMESGWDLENTLLSIFGIIATGLGITLITGSLIPLLIASIASLLLAITVAAGKGDELIAGVRKILEGFVDFFAGIFTGDIERAMGGVEKIFEGLKQALFAIIDSLEYSFNSFLDWLDEKTGGKLHDIIEFAREQFYDLLRTVKETLGGVLDAVKQILNGIILFITGVFTNDWDRAWEGVQEIFRGLWNGIVSILEGAVNLIVRGVNSLIKQLNKVSLTIPDWVPVVGGNNWSPNIQPMQELKIPRLATGHVVPPNREFLAVLGDNKTETEVVSPLSTMKQAMLEALRESGGTGGKGTTIVFEGELAALARILRPYIEEEGRRVGVSLVTK